jgi:hypothetical protein
VNEKGTSESLLWCRIFTIARTRKGEARRTSRGDSSQLTTDVIPTVLICWIITLGLRDVFGGELGADEKSQKETAKHDFDSSNYECVLPTVKAVNNAGF